MKEFEEDYPVINYLKLLRLVEKVKTNYIIKPFQLFLKSMARNGMLKFMMIIFQQEYN